MFARYKNLKREDNNFAYLGSDMGDIAGLQNEEHERMVWGLRVFEASQNGPQISNRCNNKRVRYRTIRTLRTLHSLIVCLSLN